MATITFSYNTGSVPLSKITNAFALAYNYKEIIDGRPNSETKDQFTRRMISQYVIDVVKAEDMKIARTNAELSVLPITLT